MDKTQEYDEKDTKINTDQPPLFILFFLDFVPQYFFVSSDSFICSTMGCVVENAALLNMAFLYVHVSSAGEGALILVVKVVQVVFYVSTSNYSIFQKNLMYCTCCPKRCFPHVSSLAFPHAPKRFSSKISLHTIFFREKWQ